MSADVEIEPLPLLSTARSIALVEWLARMQRRVWDQRATPREGRDAA